MRTCSACCSSARRAPKLEQLYSLRLYQRVQVTGIVRNTFQNVPWIEVMRLRAARGQLDTAVLTHLYRGEKLMEQRLWQRAIAELSLAPGDGVPPNAMRATHKNLGICLLRMGEAAGRDQLPAVRRQHDEGSRPRDREPAGDRQGAPDQAIDRTVDSRGLKDSERPMWEAFEGDKASRTTKLMR
jgi:hypothetical protein